MLKLLKQILSYSRNNKKNKTIWQYQWMSMETTKLLVPHFLSISSIYVNITIVMWHAYERVIYL